MNMQEFLNDIKSLMSDFNISVPELNNYYHSFISTGGKFIRPRLAYLFIKSFNEDCNKQQKRLIAASELLHSASLIHDDIIDNASKRRNLKTLNHIYDSRLAVIAGDYLASIAFNKILELGSLEVQKIFLSTFQEMCNAEIKQYYDRGKFSELNDYLKKNEGKTANLFATILEGCANFSSSIPKEQARNFGKAFGLAFQLKNDLTDFLSKNSEDKLNKNFTAPNIFINQGFSKEVAIEKTINLIDNEKNLAKLIIKNLPETQYKRELINMIEEL